MDMCYYKEYMSSLFKHWSCFAFSYVHFQSTGGYISFNYNFVNSFCTFFFIISLVLFAGVT